MHVLVLTYSHGWWEEREEQGTLNRSSPKERPSRNSPCGRKPMEKRLRVECGMRSQAGSYSAGKSPEDGKDEAEPRLESSGTFQNPKFQERNPALGQKTGRDSGKATM